jgi:serine/threonine protein kinase
MKEADLHFRAARLPGIVRPLAVGVDEENHVFYLVLELVRNGSLDQHLQEGGRFHAPGETWELVRVLAEAARGFANLHAAGIIHGDIACRNILLNDQWRAVICDLGHSRELLRGKEGVPIPAPRGARGPATPALWVCAVDPVTGRFTAESDVFMFGLTMWEVFSRGEPFFDNGVDPQARANMLQQGRRPVRLPLEKCPATVFALIERCWAASPRARPRMEEVADTLKGAYIRAMERAEYAREWEARMARRDDIQALAMFVQRIRRD